MSEKATGKMRALKIVFIILLVFDFASLISLCVSMIPTFKLLADYGQIMLIVTIVLSAMMLTTLAFEIVAKIFLTRSTSPAFSWASGGKGYIAMAIILLVFNFITAIYYLLSTGGVGATVINQARLYLQVIAAVAEIVAVILYLCAAKKLRKPQV